MKAAVLCPGPSLARTWAGGEYALTIGVNRAPVLAKGRLDVWAFSDGHVFWEHAPGYPVRILLTRCAEQRIDRKGHHDRLYRYAREYVEDLERTPDLDLGWRIYTKPIAMVYAYTKGAKTIDLYGDDMAGDRDADGLTDPRNNRDAKRWGRERQITSNLTTWLWRHGVSVNRISDGCT